jgi:transposase-like protein
MRYPASEKLEIIRLIEESHLSARLTLAKLGIQRTTFYRWYDRYLQRGEAGLQDQSPKPKHVWNRIPDKVRRKVVKLALKETELSARELAVTFTDKESYFVSEASTYRILKGEALFAIGSRTMVERPDHQPSLHLARLIGNYSGLSRPQVSSKTRPQPSISCGRPTSPI